MNLPLDVWIALSTLFIGLIILAIINKNTTKYIEPKENNMREKDWRECAEAKCIIKSIEDFNFLERISYYKNENYRVLRIVTKNATHATHAYSNYNCYNLKHLKKAYEDITIDLENIDNTFDWRYTEQVKSMVSTLNNLTTVFNISYLETSIEIKADYSYYICHNFKYFLAYYDYLMEKEMPNLDWTLNSEVINMCKKLEELKSVIKINLILGCDKHFNVLINGGTYGCFNLGDLERVYDKVFAQEQKIDIIVEKIKALDTVISIECNNNYGEKRYYIDTIFCDNILPKCLEDLDNIYTYLLKKSIDNVLECIRNLSSVITAEKKVVDRSPLEEIYIIKTNDWQYVANDYKELLEIEKEMQLVETYHINNVCLKDTLDASNIENLNERVNILEDRMDATDKRKAFIDGY
jgi:hypothetical protein